MAESSRITLLDDIASVLDDVAVLTKVAAKKTAGVLGDDLAVNAEQVTGVRVDRELPVVWAVAKGSAVNKLILIPVALLVSALLPPAVAVLLMLGGAFLCYEAFEKVVHKLSGHGASARREEHLDAIRSGTIDLVALEKQKIKGAIRTDFVLSAEIIVIALGIVDGKPLLTEALVLVAIGALMTAGVYGVVAGIVKLDDAGLHLSRAAGDAWHAGLRRSLGRVLLRAAPWLMKFLAVAGTVAMFLVGGGILAHGLPVLGEWLHHAAEAVATVPGVGGVLSGLVAALLNGLVGVVDGALVVGVVWLALRVRAAVTGRKSPSH